MIFYEDKFYQNTDDLAQRIGHAELWNFPEDFIFHYQFCELQPITKFDGWNISETIDDERFPLDGDEHMRNSVAIVLNANIDWEKINELLPKLWYPTVHSGEVTRDELLAFFPF